MSTTLCSMWRDARSSGGAFPATIAIILALLVSGCQIAPQRLTGQVPAGTIESGDYEKVPTWYGTDRALTDASEFRSSMTEAQKASQMYSGKRGDGELTYGLAYVSIPKSHERGKNEGPSFFSPVNNPGKHIVLMEAQQLKRDAWISGVRQIFAGDKRALIYIHGYNVDFRNAARGCAQLAYDLNFGGVPMFYSWPSRAITAAYTVDEGTIEWTAPHLTEFLTTAISATDADKVFIVAHSMGARATLRALESLQANSSLMSRIGAVILAAPDVDSSIFAEQIMPALSTKVPLILYASETDEAIKASAFVHQYPRAGGAGEGIGMVLNRGFDVIDASDVDTSLLGHSYFSTKIPLLNDISQVISGVPLGPLRSEIIPSSTGDYWVFKQAD